MYITDEEIKSIYNSLSCSTALNANVVLGIIKLHLEEPAFNDFISKKQLKFSDFEKIWVIVKFLQYNKMDIVRWMAFSSLGDLFMYQSKKYSQKMLNSLRSYSNYSYLDFSEYELMIIYNILAKRDGKQERKIPLDMNNNHFLDAYKKFKLAGGKLKTIKDK